jgi:hypothetical protein
MNSALWLQKDLEKQQAEQNLKDAYKTIKILFNILNIQGKNNDNRKYAKLPDS